MKTTTIDWAERKARAIAFIRDGLKPGKPWTSKPYVYDAATPPRAQAERDK